MLQIIFVHLFIICRKACTCMDFSSTDPCLRNVGHPIPFFGVQDGPVPSPPSFFQILFAARHSLDKTGCSVRDGYSCGEHQSTDLVLSILSLITPHWQMNHSVSWRTFVKNLHIIFTPHRDVLIVANVRWMFTNTERMVRVTTCADQKSNHSQNCFCFTHGIPLPLLSAQKSLHSLHNWNISRRPCHCFQLLFLKPS